MPESMYSARNGQCPIRRSSIGPTDHSVSMLNRMCRIEVGWCRNIEVMNVHGRLTASIGWIAPKFTSAFNADGATIDNSSSISQMAMQMIAIAAQNTGPLSRQW